LNYLCDYAAIRRNQKSISKQNRHFRGGLMAQKNVRKKQTEYLPETNQISSSDNQQDGQNVPSNDEQQHEDGNDIISTAKEYAYTAKQNKWMELVARVGFAARGILYGLIGYLAIQLIISGAGDLEDPQGAIAEVAVQPFGEVLIIVIAIGMIGMAIWGVLRAITDPYNLGSGKMAIARRISYLILGFGHLGIVHPIINILTGNGHRNNSTTEESQEVAAGILTYPWGPWAVGIVGLGFVAVGLYQIYRGASARFTRRFEEFDMSDKQKSVTKIVGRVGIVSIGVVIGIIGILALLAAFTLDPEKVGGIDAALLFLVQQPYGPYILGVVALGFIAYAAFSIMGAFWFKGKGIG
jgi:hypothetical protein